MLSFTNNLICIVQIECEMHDWLRIRSHFEHSSSGQVWADTSDFLLCLYALVSLHCACSTKRDLNAFLNAVYVGNLYPKNKQFEPVLSHHWISNHYSLRKCNELSDSIDLWTLNKGKPSWNRPIIKGTPGVLSPYWKLWMLCGLVRNM